MSGRPSTFYAQLPAMRATIRQLVREAAALDVMDVERLLIEEQALAIAELYDQIRNAQGCEVHPDD